MKKIVILIIMSLLETGCRSFAQDAMLERVLDHNSKLRSFQGVIKENWGPSQSSITSDVYYLRPDFYSVVTSPGPLKGTLASYTGTTFSIYYPSTKFFIIYKNLPSPTDTDDQALIKDKFIEDSERYDFEIGDEIKSSGLTARVLTFKAKQSDFWVTEGKSYVYDEFSFPVFHEISLKDGQTYSYQFENIKFNGDIPQSKFIVKPPKGAIISEWDAASKKYSLDEVKHLANFKILLPKTMKKEMKLITTIKQRGPIPSFAWIYSERPYFLFLTAFKDYGLSMVPSGKEIKLKSHKQGQLVFGGGLVTYTFSQDGTVYVLTSNLSFEDVIEIADSI